MKDTLKKQNLLNLLVQHFFACVVVIYQFYITLFSVPKSEIGKSSLFRPDVVFQLQHCYVIIVNIVSYCISSARLENVTHRTKCIVALFLEITSRTKSHKQVNVYTCTQIMIGVGFEYHFGISVHRDYRSHAQYKSRHTIVEQYSFFYSYKNRSS